MLGKVREGNSTAIKKITKIYLKIFILHASFIIKYFNNLNIFELHFSYAKRCLKREQ
jgi:hypothetical protein